MLKIVGIILIILGLLALIFGQITFTKKEKVLDLGPIEATAEKKERLPLPRAIGAIVLFGGIVLLIAGARKKT